MIAAVIIGIFFSAWLIDFGIKFVQKEWKNLKETFKK